MTKAWKKQYHLGNRKIIVVGTFLIAATLIIASVLAMQVAEQHDLSIATHDPVPTLQVPTIDGKATPIVGTSPIDSPAPSSGKGPDLETSAHASSGNITYTPKCRGAGCVTANPGYSINTNSAITVMSGTAAGPFVASTSSGATVNWSTPQYNGTGFGPYGYTNGSMNAPSLQYFIRADPNVPSGTYMLYLSAMQSRTETLVRAAITVTVLSLLDSSGMPVGQ